MNSYFKSSNMFHIRRELNQVPTLIQIYTIVITMLYRVLKRFMYINQLVTFSLPERLFPVAKGLNLI
ncbi:hypothetical protein XELAEV_18013268mg [Xenopus laevis]|uniref:Uncharacterized protein n=1 Tax=Xenopus laevis TaxID=8355 RepID=A0A974DQK7_XENLA|nr:hypothetical protein XELAEV_18013268mg [Xenopus laevis]